MLCKKTNGFELISPGKFDFSTRRPAAGAALRSRRRAALPSTLTPAAMSRCSLRPAAAALLAFLTCQPG